MAAMARQPFAPLDGARLQALTSLKNRQNAPSPSPPSAKRKADAADDCENVDPLFFAKRSKAAASSSPSQPKALLPRPVLATPRSHALLANSPSKPASTPRRVLKPQSPAVSLHSRVKSSPMSAPAGRSPTHPKRPGILSSRRLHARLAPPRFSLDAAPAPFSLDAALEGTIAPFRPGPSKPAASAARAAAAPSDLGPLGDAKASWFFDIHEDSPEQEMTNLLQHSTCVLDISSDDESEQRARRDRDEGRDKENIPPPDDVSQTSVRNDMVVDKQRDMVVDKQRVALGEMQTADFYPQGCDATSVIIVPGDDVDANVDANANLDANALGSVASLMSSPSDASSKAAVLQPIEGTGERFDLWESGSAKDETETLPAES